MKHVIVVDDDPAIQDAFKFIFDPKQVKVTVYAGGETILDGTSVVPDLYILDKQLAGVDGLEICRFIKNSAATRHLPVLLLSATPGIKQLAAAACADAALSKPFSIKELRGKALELLGGNDDQQQIV